MMRMSKAACVFAMLGFFMPIAFATPTGTSFTYQGQLKENGSPANGTYDIRFVLFDASTAGTQVGMTVCMDNVAVTAGLFTATLDFGAQFMGQDRWLEISVRADATSSNCGTGAYTTLSPRQLLTASPYALALPGLWTQNNGTSPNIVGGFSGNSVVPGVVGGTIAGGGSSGSPNVVSTDYGVVGGGQANQASGVRSTVSGGAHNQATNTDTTVSGGFNNTASGPAATIGGGDWNTAGDTGTISGGISNTASGVRATIAGGQGNSAIGMSATIGGGTGNVASGIFSTVLAGTQNQAGGDFSLAAGRRAKVRDAATVGGGDPDGDQGTFVWADSTDADFVSTGPNQFLIRASGGVGIGTNNPGSFALAVNGTAANSTGSWSVFSDQRLKKNIRHVAPGTLDRVLALHAVTFEYTSEAIRSRNVTPGQSVGFLAQDVENVFPEWVSKDKEGYRYVTERGTTALMVEALRDLRAEKDRQLAEKDATIADLSARLARLEKAVSALEGDKQEAGH
ncbi:MAG: tail fiber domain-containing protein [Phycisphaerae bacterium]